MPFAQTVRLEVESALSRKIPSALTPAPKLVRPVTPTHIAAIDDLLYGGLPVGAITEFVGPESSGRSTTALSTLAYAVSRGDVCAWVDVDDTLDPETAALSGIDWARLLWVRCQSRLVPTASSTLTAPLPQSSATSKRSSIPSPSGGGGSPHPRSEGRGMSQAIQNLLLAQPRSAAMPLKRRDKSIGTPGVPNRPLQGPAPDREEQIAFDRLPPRRGENLATRAYIPRCSEPLPPRRKLEDVTSPSYTKAEVPTSAPSFRKSKQNWTPLDQALRATDLLLQSGGFSFLVLDLGSTPAAMSWRIPLATWFRFRAACERSRCTLILLTQYPCARSSAELVLTMQAGRMQSQNNVMTGIAYKAEIERQRFTTPTSNVVSIRKPPCAEHPGQWERQASWAI